MDNEDLNTQSYKEIGYVTSKQPLPFQRESQEVYGAVIQNQHAFGRAKRI